MNFLALRHLTFLTCFGWYLSLAYIQPAKADISQPQVRFEFQALPFQHTDGASGEKYFLEPLGSGVALFDYDNDNDLDLYFVNGNSLQSSDADNSYRNRLFRNDDMNFVDITDLAGVGDTGYGLGCCVGDYNNDGLLSKNEVLDDTEFSKLVGVNVNTLATGLDFKSLGEKLKDSMNEIPFIK